MLVAAAVCPCPPLLVPEVAAGAAPELDALRASCADAIGVLAASRPDRLVVVGPSERADSGSDPGPDAFAEGATGSFWPFGVSLDVRLGAVGTAAAGPEVTAGPPPSLPLSLAVAAWL